MSGFTFKLPDLGEGMVEAEIAEWMVKVGDEVKEEDPICSMLTDKAAVELTSPVSGKVISVAGEEGDMVTVGSALIVFATSGVVAVETVEQPASAPEEPQAETSAPSVTSGKVATSPSIRAQARETGVDLAQIPGTGPRGRILKKDFEAFVTGGGIATLQPRTGVTEIKVIGLRRKIAERLAASASEIPHFTYVEEVDVTALESLREHLNSKKSTGESKLTPLAFLGIALVRVLRDFPQCNAHYDKDRNVIVGYEAVHLGIATQTSDGLKVPVARHSEARSLEDLASEIRRVSTAARDNTDRLDHHHHQPGENGWNHQHTHHQPA